MLLLFASTSRQHHSICYCTQQIECTGTPILLPLCRAAYFIACSPKARLPAPVHAQFHAQLHAQLHACLHTQFHIRLQLILSSTLSSNFFFLALRTAPATRSVAQNFVGG